MLVPNAGGCLFEFLFKDMSGVTVGMSGVTVGHVKCFGLAKAVREALGYIWALFAAWQSV